MHSYKKKQPGGTHRIIATGMHIRVDCCGKGTRLGKKLATNATFDNHFVVSLGSARKTIS
jgi:hypothetical protein